VTDWDSYSDWSTNSFHSHTKAGIERFIWFERQVNLWTGFGRNRKQGWIGGRGGVIESVIWKTSVSLTWKYPENKSPPSQRLSTALTSPRTAGVINEANLFLSIHFLRIYTKTHSRAGALRWWKDDGLIPNDRQADIKFIHYLPESWKTLTVRPLEPELSFFIRRKRMRRKYLYRR
jgi:hypothetical protein